MGLIKEILRYNKFQPYSLEEADLVKKFLENHGEKISEMTKIHDHDRLLSYALCSLRAYDSEYQKLERKLLYALSEGMRASDQYMNSRMKTLNLSDQESKLIMNSENIYTYPVRVANLIRQSTSLRYSTFDYFFQSPIYEYIETHLELTGKSHRLQPKD